MGICLRLGEGVDADDAEAFRLFARAAAQGHTGAESNLGYMYAHGLGVDADPAEACRWYARAAAKGHATAAANVADLRALAAPLE